MTSVVAGLIEQSKMLPRELYKSLTWDRGKELSDHMRFTLATDIQVYPRNQKARDVQRDVPGFLLYPYH